MDFGVEPPCIILGWFPPSHVDLRNNSLLFCRICIQLWEILFNLFLLTNMGIVMSAANQQYKEEFAVLLTLASDDNDDRRQKHIIQNIWNNHYKSPSSSSLNDKRLLFLMFFMELDGFDFFVSPLEFKPLSFSLDFLLVGFLKRIFPPSSVLSFFSASNNH